MKSTISLVVAIAISAIMYTPLVASASPVALDRNTTFSGYAEDGSPGQFSAVSANWVIPKITCSSGKVTYVSQWVGIQDSLTLVQDGVDYDCGGASSQPVYLAWYEIYGPNPNDPEIYAPAKDLIEAGDIMRASVTFISGKWEFRVENLSRHWQFFAAVSQPTPPDTRSSAEFLVEGATPSYPGFVPLSRFRSTSFYDAHVTSHREPGPISSFFPLAQCAGKKLLITPGALKSAGTSFTDTMMAEN